MDFKDKCKQLATRIAALKEQIATEEATKNAFIMPFIQMLGYDVFNPLEVVPEMDCDLVKAKGEKIDYAIMTDNEPVMLIECKHWQQNLDLHSCQLQKYFVASKARFGLLTNGIVYRFYTDLVKPNIMDDLPFLEVNFNDLKDAPVEELKKFHKSYFNIDDILSTASELKYTNELKAVIKAEFAAPSAELVRVLAKRVYDGIITPKALEMFTDLVKRSLSSHVNDVISERLNVAMKGTESPQNAPEPSEPTNTPEESKITTTEEEMEAYRIIKAIVRDVIAVERVTMRDAQSYCAIFADDNNRRPICRLYFNSANKAIGTINADKSETKHKLESLDDIYSLQAELRASAQLYADM